MRPVTLALVVLLAASRASAQDGEKPAPANPPAPAPAAEDAAPAPEPPVVDPKARETMEKAERLLYSVRSTAAKTVGATVVIEDTPIGPLGFDFTWTRATETAPETLEVKASDSVDESLRPLVEAQGAGQIKGFVEGIVIGGRAADVLKDCSATWRAVEGGGCEVACTYVGGPRKGTSETRTFDAERGIPVHVATETTQGQTILQDRVFAKQGDRYRLESFRHQVPQLSGDTFVLDGKLEWFDCGGVALVWKFVQEDSGGGSRTLRLERCSVDGKAFPTPDEVKAAEAAKKAAAPPPAATEPAKPAGGDGE